MSTEVLHAIAPAIAASPAQPDIMFFCPGCKCGHGVWTSKAAHNGAQWSWNGDMVRPTFSPSLLISSSWQDERGPQRRVCHSFVREGMIQFLGDCTHELANQTVALQPF